MPRLCSNRARSSVATTIWFRATEKKNKIIAGCPAGSLRTQTYFRRSILSPEKELFTKSYFMQNYRVFLFVNLSARIVLSVRFASISLECILASYKIARNTAVL